jgi:hypothetical protein
MTRSIGTSGKPFCQPTGLPVLGRQTCSFVSFPQSA